MNQNELINNIKLFFQTLYNKHTGSNLNFEHRILNHSNGAPVLQIVSPSLSENEAQQVVNNLKKHLPSSAYVTIAPSLKVPGQFRAIIFNPEYVFNAFVENVAKNLNKFHSIPGRHSWNSIDNIFIGYRTKVFSPYQPNFTEDLEEKIQNSIHEMTQYNAYLKELYPGLEIKITHFNKNRDSLVSINSFTYEDYYSMMRPSLRALGISFFKSNKNQYEQDKSHLPEILKEDIESSHQFDL
jgi:hypothetical protein